MKNPAFSAASDPESDGMLDAPTDAGAPASPPTESAERTELDDLDAPTIAHQSSATSVSMTGQKVGDYEVVREIARGGMGVVYLAKQSRLNRFVALKMVLESDSASAEDLQRFSNEARAAGGLDHPGIVPVYDVGTHNGCPFFSMGYVDGKSLAAELSDGPLPPQRAAEIGRDVARAIGHAHDENIIHRDLKPANILIDSDGLPKVTDFGVCKSLVGQSHLTTHGELIGTPHYMPPEQAGTPDAEAGPASDVYSIGAVLYASLTARPPFQAPSPIDVIAQVMTKDPVPPSHFYSGVPQDLETITLKCLAKAPKDRYQTAHQLASDLDRFLNDEPILARPPGIVKRVRHAVRRHVFLASVSGSFAITLVVFAVLLGFALLQSQAKVVQLTELLAMERAGARRMVGTQSRSGGADAKYDSNSEYDVQRLTDEAVQYADKDRQLAIHLSVYAGKLAIEKDVAPPQELRDVLVKFVSSPQRNQAPETANFAELVARAEQKVERKLTNFERVIYGLPEASGETGAPSSGSETKPTSTPQPSLKPPPSSTEIKP